MLRTLKDCLASREINTVRIATGYWDLPGLALLADDFKAFFERGGRLLLLIGNDPYVYASQVRNPKYKDLTYPADYIRTDLCELEPKAAHENAVRLILEHCTTNEDSAIEIRIFHKNEDDEIQFLHSKCYIFTGDIAIGIVGSSNFTQKGLEGNAELNYMETNWLQVTSGDTSNPYQKSHLTWFNEKWGVSEPWNKTFLEQVLKQAPITKKVVKKQTAPFTPYELYVKLLQIQFGDVVDKSLRQQIESYLPANARKLDYQIEAVIRCLGIMHEHGGFMLGDVVGLGKTVVASLIIKRFLTDPDDHGRERKVLVITPPAVQSGWKRTIEMFDNGSEDKMAPKIDFITTGRIASFADDDDELDDADDDSMDSGEFVEPLQDKNYGLIVIDESHKFRNNKTKMYSSLDELIGRIGGDTGTYPYVGLLSATPQNNRPSDLKNQIYLFERNHTDSTLKKADGGNIEHFFSVAESEYKSLLVRPRVFADYGYFVSDMPDGERQKRLMAISKRMRDCILSDILERRTRTDVEKFYNNDVESQGLVFPKIVGPNELKYVMDDELARLFYDTMTIIAPQKETENDNDNEDDPGLGYYRYRAIEFLADSDMAREKYAGKGNRSVTHVARQLATIMQTLLVKRLESSFAAFTESLRNLRRYTENMIMMWENNTIFVCPQINVNHELDFAAKSKQRGRRVTFDDCVEEIRDKIKKLEEQGRNEKGQNAEYKRGDFNENFIYLLKKDLMLISGLCDRWAENTEDPKFDAFKENLKTELFDPQKNTSGKLVIFSEAISTVKSLERAVRAKGFRPLVVTAANRSENEHIIAENFDANYDGERKDDYDVIITTEVLAEGVNLHRANVILNYDTPWNATRLMQRIGRVNRIGGKEPFVYVYNFMPSAQGDAMIKLVRKAHTKLQSFHVLFGEDSKIFSENEEVVHYDIGRAIDGEESPTQKYILELKQYKEAHPERYRQIESADAGWQIARATSGTALFLVKAPHAERLAVKVTPPEEGQPGAQIISRLEMLEEMRVDQNAKSAPLPDNWQELSADAILAYNQYFVRVSNSRGGDKRAQALDIIVKLYQNPTLSSTSKNLLKNARKLVDKGSYDIVRKMLAIGRELEEGGSRLFAVGQKEIDEILEREIGKLAERVENRQGKAEIVLGTIK